MIKCAVVSTKFGWLAMCASEAGLVYLTLPGPSRRLALSEIKEFTHDLVEDASVFTNLSYRLQRYFDGEKVNFPDKLDLSDATPFQRTVWSLARAIPYGETRSYAWVARQIGSPDASRAVGGALARNRFPVVVPCHRVVASDGGLGGFSGGLLLKKRLLELEAAS